jgi:aspartate racemase
MGPAATVDLLQRIVAATPAEDDSDHLHVLVDNNPGVPSRIAALLEGSGLSPAPCMVQMARGLVASGARLLAIPCNTAHYYYPEVAGQVSVPVINLLEVVADYLAGLQSRPQRVGLLASTAVQRIDLYGPVLAARGMQGLFPAAALQRQVMALIRAVKAGRDSGEQWAVLEHAARDLSHQGADVLLVACTELSTRAAASSGGLPAFDAAQLLAEEIVRRARNVK